MLVARPRPRWPRSSPVAALASRNTGIPAARAPWDGHAMLRALWAAVGCGALALFAPVPARADDSAPAATPLTYALAWVRAEGAEQCPTGRAVMTEVERRVGRPVFDAEAERSFEVEVTRLGETYRSDV